jgi:hypothetical protein
MMDDDDSSCSIMSPSVDGTTTGHLASTMVSPEGDRGVGVKEPVDNDVLCGRGGSINSHPGNERFRTLVEKRKRVYLTARFKREKRLIANSIVSEIRAIQGRFLQRDPKSGLWKDIGDEKARDKTSQALRENAPSIRAEIEDEINEQRAELYSNDETHSSPATHSPYPPPPPANSYYNNSWYPSYYGYPPPPPPPPHYPPHPGYPPPHHNGAAYDYDQHHYPYGAPPPPPRPAKSSNVIEQTADLVSSGAEAIKSWTKASFSFGGSVTGGGNDNATINTNASSKPISYKHEERRKMVKFRDDSYGGKRRRVRPCYSPVHNNRSDRHHGYHHHDDDDDEYEEDLEPQSVDVATNASLMSQVANHILGTLGTWDGPNICGTSTTIYQDDDEKVPMPIAEPSEYTQDTEMGAEWEGQEVQLMVEEKRDEMRMPPPPPPQRRGGGGNARDSHTGTSVAFSSLGSCHSWLPEQMAAASSYFSGRGDPDQHSLNNSMMMMDMAEYSATGSVAYTAENCSVNDESLGGGSLTNVFEHPHGMTQPTSMPSPNLSHRDLHQIPSWERSLRSKSPLSLGDDDDGSLISRTSSKGALSSVPSMGDEMTWTRE